MGIQVIRILILAIAVSAFSWHAGQAQERPLSPFVPGEKLTYDVTWSIFPAGEVVATLTKTGGAPGDDFEVKTTAQTQGFVSLLYRVNDEFHSVFNSDTLCSSRISKTVEEGRRRKNIQIVFDANRKLALLDERDLTRPENPVKHAEHDIPPCVSDVVSAFYFLRRHPLRLEESVRVPTNDGAKTADVTVEVQAREQVETPLGRQPALRLEPKIFGGLYNKKKGRLLIWLSDDEKRLPLRIRMMTSFGSITGTLKSVDSQPEITAGAKP